MSCEKSGISYTQKSSLNDYYSALTDIYNKNDSSIEKIIDFSKYAPSTAFVDVFARYELVKLIKDIPGDIFEMGVCGGRGIFSFYHSLTLLEPNYEFREIIGFDTFSGITGITQKDENQYRKINEGDFTFCNKNELVELAKIHEQYKANRINTNRIKLIEGDIMDTLPEFLENNKHKLVSLLYLDLDIYKPTKFSIEKVLPRMCKGSVIAFDELYYRSFPGETVALLESFNINDRKIHNVLNSRINYIII